MMADLSRYDFRRPDRISKDRLRPLQFLYDRFARNLGTSLSAYLRVGTEVSLTSVEQATYAEFLASLPEQTAYYAVGLEPVKGVVGLEVNPAAAYAMIDRMLGGHGVAAPVDRGLTDIEQRVVDNVVRLILEHMTEEWRHVVRVEFTVQRRETRPQLLQIAAPNDAVIALRLQVRLGESEGDLKFCLPAALLEEMGPGFVDRWSSRGRKPLTTAEQQALYGNLARIPLQAEAVIETPFPAADLVRLGVGDVVSLGVSVKRPVEFHICGTKKFTGMLTRSPHRTGLTIQAPVGQPISASA
jgi:flagellar motor switch protein FliM